MVWTEHNVSGGSITKTDHYPLWIARGDSWEYVLDTSKVQEAEKIIAFKFRLDGGEEYIKCFATASNTTLTFGVYLGGSLVGEASEIVTTEEDVELQVNIKELGLAGGEGECVLKADGDFEVKADSMKIVAYYRAGWAEHTAISTTWTEGTVS